MSISVDAIMKPFVIILLATLLMPGLTPMAEGIEQGRQNALQRLADRSKPSGPSQTQQIVDNNPAAIAKLIKDIDAAARTNKERMMSIIIINTDVAGATLEKEKARTGFSFGEIYVAHALALSTGKKFDAIVALKKRGQTWSQIAQAHNVRLKGSKELLEEMKKK
jgi:hypothetical protein